MSEKPVRSYQTPRWYVYEFPPPGRYLRVCPRGRRESLTEVYFVTSEQNVYRGVESGCKWWGPIPDHIRHQDCIHYYLNHQEATEECMRTEIMQDLESIRKEATRE